MQVQAYVHVHVYAHVRVPIHCKDAYVTLKPFTVE